MAQVAAETQVVGAARGVPLPGGLTSKQQEEVEEEEGGDEQEAHDARVGDEGESEGAR